MTLSRKGSRIIRRDGAAYRWVVAREETALHLVVEAADRPGQRLYVEFDSDSSVLPSLVSRFIDDALVRGWRPAGRGPELRFGCADGRLIPLGPWRESRRRPP